MSTAALQIIELVKSLPADEQRAVCDVLSRDTKQSVVYGEPLSDSDIAESARVTFAALEAVRSLHGRFAGGNLLDSLLRERARDRAREDEQLRR